MVFEVVLKLRENDEESRGVMSVLASCTHKGDRRTLGGGGGYLHGAPQEDDDFIVTFCFQKNDDATGNLVDVTEADRELVRRALLAHPNVDQFLVGPIEPDGDASEADLLRQFREGRGVCSATTKVGA